MNLNRVLISIVPVLNVFSFAYKVYNYSSCNYKLAYAHLKIRYYAEG